MPPALQPPLLRTPHPDQLLWVAIVTPVGAHLQNHKTKLSMLFFLGDLVFKNKKLVFFFAILQAAQAPMQILGVLGLGA